MIDFIVGLFSLGGNTTLSSFGIPLSSTVSSLLDEFSDDSTKTSLLLTSTSVWSAVFNRANAEEIQDRQVKDMQMLVESMSLEELQELRDLVDEKGNSYKLNL